MKTPRYRRWCHGLLSIAVALLLSGYTFKNGKKGADDDFVAPPYMTLIGQALRGKDTQAAARFLKAARRCWQKRKRACGFTKQIYLTYLGVLTLQRGNAKRAVILLEQAHQHWQKATPPPLKKTPRKPLSPQQKRMAAAHRNHQRWGHSLAFYMGQAYFREKQYKRAAKALRQAAALVGKMPGYYHILGRAELEAGQYRKARQTLQIGLNKFPKDRALLQLAALLYLKIGAWQAALDLGRRLLQASPKGDPTSFLVAVDAMRLAGLIYQVLPLLEEARIQMPGNRAVLLRLAIAYSKAQMHLSAARCFSTLAPQQPGMAYFAAAAWMQAGKLRRALLWNQRVKDPAKRLRQRSTILLSQRQFARVFALLKRRWQQKTLAPQGRYRLAYVAIRLGRYRLASALLSSLRGTSHASLAQQLSKTQKLCQATPWRCLD